MSQTLLGAIRANTGDPQPPLVGAHHLFSTVCANGPMSVGAATQAMDEAVGDTVLRWTDGDGTVRYALTTEGLDAVTGTNPYTAADVDALRDVITTEASRSDPDQSVIAWCNQRLAEVQE